MALMFVQVVPVVNLVKYLPGSGTGEANFETEGGILCGHPQNVV